MSDEFQQSELAQLSAWLDGELDDRRAAQVAAKVAGDPRWRAEADRLRRLDGLLDAWQAPPLRRDLSGDILAKAHRRPGVPSWVRAAAPLAAAAAIFAAVLVLHGPWRTTTKPEGPIASLKAPAGEGDFDVQVDKLLADVPEEDRLVVKNLDILQDYDVLVSFETLQALDRLEHRPGGS